MMEFKNITERYPGGEVSGSANKSATVGFQLTVAEKLDLVEFLRSLTDQELLTDARWSNPWPSRR